MDLALEDDQRALADSVAGALRRGHDFAARLALLRAPPGGPGGWGILANDLGLAGLRIAVEAEGQGGSALNARVVMEALGRRLVLDAFAERCIVVPALLAGVAHARDLLAAVARGEARVAAALAEAGFDGGKAEMRQTSDGFVLDGEIRFVVGGPGAQHFLVAARPVDDACDIALFLLPATAVGLSRHDYRMADGKEASDLVLTGVRLSPPACLAQGEQCGLLLARARDEGIAALCAEAVGVMREMIELTIDFTSRRRQFGAAIASFQVVQHRIVDMAIALEKADALALHAALTVDGGDDRSRAQAVAAAKIVVSEAVRLVAQSAVQLHGATGTANDTPISHYFRRATVIGGQYMTAAHTLERYAEGFALERNAA